MNVYDITAEAGTSISTVLRVLNNEGNVNPRVKDRMEAILKKYDYKPSAIARDMVSKAMKNIVTPTMDVRVTHYARMIYVIEQKFDNLGYDVSACNTGGSMQEYNRYSEILSEKQTDGIVLIGSALSELIKYPEIIAKIEGTPVIVVNGQVKLSNFYPVLIGDTEAIRMASDYMFDHGHIDSFCILDITTDSDRAKRQGSSEAMELRDMPDGDGRVPEDIAVTGCNNSPDSGICEPELTTLDNKPRLLGGMCASLLRDRMEGKESATSVAARPGLVVWGPASS